MSQTPQENAALPDNPLQARMRQLKAERERAAQAPPPPASTDADNPFAGPRSDEAQSTGEPMGEDISFWATLPEALAFVFRPRALLIQTLLPAGLFLAVFGALWFMYGMLRTTSVVPLFMLLIVLAMFVFAFLARIIHAGTAREPVMPPPPGSGHFVDEFICIGGLTLLVYIISMLPVIAYLLFAAADMAFGAAVGNALANATGHGLVAGLLWIACSAYFPLAMLSFVRSNRFGAIWPPTALKVLRAVPGEFIAVLVMHVGLQWLLGQLGQHSTGFLTGYLLLVVYIMELSFICYALGLIAACKPSRLAFLDGDKAPEGTWDRG